MDIPEEYLLICKGCGKHLDLRDASVLLHGWIVGDEVKCYEGEVDYLYSQKIGEPVIWTKDKKPIGLN